LVSDLPALAVDMVIAQGRVLAENGQVQIDLPSYPYPDWAKQSVHLQRPLKAADFILPAPEVSSVTAHVIGIVENQAPTRHLCLTLPVEAGEVGVDMSRDIAKIAVVERHRGEGRVQVGLIQGFGFKSPCAVGTTVAHDSHHIIVVGTCEADMALAVNKLAEVGGGQVVVKEGQVIGLVELPIAGLMSNERAEVVAHKAVAVLDGFRACGCMINNPNMQLSLAALVVIPELRISDLGLVDVTRFDFIPVIERI
jgi:adenine deaminase